MPHWIPIAALVAINILIFSIPAQAGFSVSFLDVGQGDAILIQGPTGVQVLVDGGPDPSVLRELGSMLPFFDRTIDAVVATHPDKDHIAGLVDVLERYEVATFIESGIPSDTAPALALQAALGAEGAERVLARRGMRLVLGKGAYADILFPDRDVSGVETNTGSIVMRVVYGDTSIMLTGDSPQAIEKYLVSLGGLESDILKAGHHGSKTSSSEEFITQVRPAYTIFSRGCDNSYGHPHPEVVERFNALKIKILDTCAEGTITFISDGKTLSVSTR